ncbi:CsoS2 family carboxysome shell protein [Hydrogenovibrio sp. JE_KL2]|uniref:carboxysome assembly protein CsoS2 n=1 Tax=Hydrogenovibrio sp. JE_KL2 TaxID=2651188 RepID=UPI00128E0B5C|nr:CsoS2 family carboxysome shell protein [Hydrogenovibrio sp. JE_KL2]MPQ77275.1 carboxysome shell protein [Hydrogenovibrio sp. JE_KL2]
MSNNAQSGRAAAIARRKAQVKGKGVQASATPVATRETAPAPEPIVIATAPTPSQPSRPRREVSSAASAPASAAGREAAKQKRQQQKSGKSATQAAKPTPHPKTRAKQQSEEPIVEPRQTRSEQPAKRQERRTAVKPEATVQSSGRLQSKAYRQAQVKGKVGQAAFKSKGGSQSGAKAKLANPDASSREIAKQIRAEQCSRGKVCSTGASRPTRPPRNAELPQKVGESETLSGQTVSGTQVGQGKKKMTGAETGACQLVSGTEYLGAEEFNNNCSSQPAAKPAKVTQTQTTRGQIVSGSTGVGRAEKMTGNEPGTCSAVTGTEYLPADQGQAFCGTAPVKAKAAGFSVMSQPAQKSGGKITGGDSRKSQSTTIKPTTPAKAPQKVMFSQTAKGNTTTGTQVGRLETVTGGDKGACKSVTGTGYQSVEEAETLCKMPAVDTATKVTASGTRGGQKVTGDRSGAYYGMTGAEAGDCQAITGTPYTGSEQSQFCSVDQQNEMKVRQPRGMNPSISGVQPGPVGLTGAQKGACELVTGTYYQGTDQTAMLCGPSSAAQPGESDFPMTMAQAAAEPMVEDPAEQGTKITGDGWDRGSKVTGTDGPWAAQRNASIKGSTRQSPMGAAQFNAGVMGEVPMSPITGSSGNTETGAKVTLSGGARA